MKKKKDFTLWLGDDHFWMIIPFAISIVISVMAALAFLVITNTWPALFIAAPAFIIYTIWKYRRENP